MENITTFLKSGLLEKYVLGNTTQAESLEVESYISEHEEIQDQYNLLQNSLEILAQVNAVKPPKNSLQIILDKLDDKPVVNITNIHKKSISWLTYTSTAAAILFAALTTFFFYQNKQLSHENQVVVDEIFDLRGDINKTNKRLEDIMNQFMKLNNPETEKYIIRGNQRAKNLKTVAYINPKEKTSMIEVVSLPQLPEEKCYQMWAQMNDRMVSLGILDPKERDLKQIPYAEDALGLSITIEPKGGNETATLENSVANISLNKQ